LGYWPSRSNTCLFIRKEVKGNRSYLIIYVDDGGIFAHQTEVKRILTELAKHFVDKDVGKMESFVGCKIIENKAKNTIYIHQRKLLNNLKEQFSELVESLKDFEIPAPPQTIIKRPAKDDTLLLPDQQTKFGSGVGMLLYLVKHSRFDISNSVRELSKVADGATKEHWKLLLRNIKYVITTGYLALKLKPNANTFNFFMEGTQTEDKGLTLGGTTDSEFGENLDCCISVFGYNIYFCEAIITWKSKAGQSVTLSLTKAEYVALSEITKEVMFVKQVLETMGIKLNLPILVKIDNVGAIHLSNNHSLSQQTKHIDI
jgi:hypothetical protein